MIQHFVVFRPLPGCGPELAAALQRFATALPPELPGVVELVWGENFQPRSRELGYTHCLSGRLTGPELLPDYQAHPLHQELLAVLERTCESRLAFDHPMDGA